jgi:two-component system OmpR family response regulator
LAISEGELLSVLSVLRRSQGQREDDGGVASSGIVAVDGWELHRVERTLVSPTGPTVPLSNAELRLLNTFLQTPRQLVSRDPLMEQARGRAMDAFERSMDLLVSRLRQKLANDSSASSMMRTVRGAGYLFNVQSVQARMVWRA